MAAATFSGVSPPAIISGFGESRTSSALTDQSWVRPVAPLAPVAGLKLSVMNMSTHSAEVSTTARSSSMLSDFTTRLLST